MLFDLPTLPDGEALFDKITPILHRIDDVEQSLYRSFSGGRFAK